MPNQTKGEEKVIETVESKEVIEVDLKGLRKIVENADDNQIIKISLKGLIDEA